MDYLIAILAGALQGLTEFLPVSSTAHLVIFQKVFSLPPDKFGLGFDASIHLGTLLAVAIFFFKDYTSLIIFKNQLYKKLIIGTIPAVIIGMALEKAIENEFRSLTVVGVALVFFSLVIYWAEQIGKKKKNDSAVTLLDSVVIGFAQALALIPGVSRSGATISAGLFLGLTRESAARFAFMLSGPIIAGAGLKKFIEALSNGQSSNIGLLLAGITTSFVFGYLTIKYFIKFLATKNLYIFIIYRIVLGILLIGLPYFVQ